MPNVEPLIVEVVSETPDWDRHDGLEPLIIRALRAAAEAEGTAGAEVAVSLVDDAAQRELNRVWRGKDSATNVLSFPAAPVPGGIEGPRQLGDIILAYETVAREAAESGKAFEAHVAHLAIHGFLHLTGYDHETETDAETMESLEVRILARLGFDDPYDNDPSPPSPD